MNTEAKTVGAGTSPKTFRTQAEIIEQFTAIEDEDFFGTQRSDLLTYMEYDSAAPHLKEGVTREEWDNLLAEVKTPREQILGYLDFAWGKANDQRGLSADRSIQHFLAWTWLDDADFYDTLKASYETGYCHYGKPQLILVSEKYGFNWQGVDDGVRSNG